MCVSVHKNKSKQYLIKQKMKWRMPGDQGSSSSVKLKSFHLSPFLHLYIKLRTVSANLILEFENSVFTPNFACVMTLMQCGSYLSPLSLGCCYNSGRGQGHECFPPFQWFLMVPWTSWYCPAANVLWVTVWTHTNVKKIRAASQGHAHRPSHRDSLLRKTPRL